MYDVQNSYERGLGEWCRKVITYRLFIHLMLTKLQKYNLKLQWVEAISVVRISLRELIQNNMLL